MMLISVLYFAGLGLIVGSFLNVLVLRKGVMSLNGRSICPSCGKQIAWYDNVPVVSWLILRGRCRNCGSSISMQYPIVEAITAMLFAMLGIWAAPYAYYPDMYLAIAIYLGIIAILVAVAVYDILHTIIPDEWSFVFAALSFATYFLVPFSGLERSLLAHVLAGPVAALPLFLLWLFSGGRWMGLGDPKLALGIGWLLGMPLAIVAVFSSFIIGSFVLVPLLAYEKLVTHKGSTHSTGGGLTMKSEVPFGPFLIASCFLIWFMGLYGVDLPLYLFGL